MAWSKNIATYPPQMLELFERLMSSGQPSIHTFSDKHEAAAFERAIQGVRYAMTQTKDGPYVTEAAKWTAERVDEVTVRLCSINDTKRASLAYKALLQRREQDTARGIEFVPYAPAPTEGGTTP